MDDMRDSFVFRKDWYDAIKDLDKDVKVEVYDAIMSLVFEDANSDISPVAQMAMRFILPSIKRDEEKYNSICEQRKLFGSKGGIAKATKSYQKVAKGSKSKQELANDSKTWQNVANVADNDILSSTNVESNISSNNKEELSKDISEKKAVKTNYPEAFEKDFQLYGRKGSKKKAYERWKVLSGEDKELMRRHIPFYLQSNERQYLKDFEGYINQRLFESPVYKQSKLLFDPQNISQPESFILSDEQEALLEKAYAEIDPNEEAALYGVDAFEFATMPRVAKDHCREMFKEKMLKWIGERQDV